MQKRVHERFERRLRVSVELDGTSHEAVSQNISLGGMFLATQADVALGSTVSLSFHIPAPRHEVKCAAFVRWKRPDGVGVQFDSLRAKDVWALNQFFRSEESAGNPPLPGR